jgi:hypothetical protein
LTETENAVALPFIMGFVAAMGKWAKANAFLWYHPLSQYLRSASSIAVQTFAKERGRRPTTLLEVVEQGILPFVPADPFSGEPLGV